MKSYHIQQTGTNAGSWVPCPAKKRCRVQGQHLAETEYHQLLNREHLTSVVPEDADTIIKIADLNNALNRTYTPLTSYGWKDGLVDLEADTAEASALMENPVKEELEAFIQRRVDHPNFRELLKKRDATIALLEETKADRELLKAYWEKTPEFWYEDVRQKELAILDLNQELTLLYRQVNEYKNVNARVAALIGEMEETELKGKGEWLEYEEDTLNNMTRTVMYESGTREWLEQRQEGIGGSDVGPILRLKGAYNTREDIMKSKLEPITDEQVQEQTTDEILNAARRGDAWEKHLLMKVKTNNPDLNVTYCKASWKHNENTFQFANFDGLTSDEHGNPDGIVEIKTASDARKWGDPALGLDGIPPTYRTQTLWYAQAAGLKKGVVAVLIDDHDYREYHFTVTPEIEEEANRNLEAVKKFNEELAARKNGTWVGAVRNRGFSNEAVNSSLVNKAKQEVFREVAAMRGVGVRDVEREFVRNVDRNRVRDRAYIANQLRELYVETAKRDDLPPFVGVDLETAGAQPTQGYILEFGASVRSNYATSNLWDEDTEERKVSKLYGLPRKALVVRGTGNSDVHGISEGQVAKKRQFSNVQEADTAMRLFTKYRVMLAHNAGFEQRWFNTHLPGFADAVKRGRIRVLDSMKLSKRLLPDAENDTLEALVARYNVPYLGAHRAYRDAEMMSYAYERLLRELRTGSPQITPK